MIYLIVAYAPIAVVLSGYGLYVWQRTRDAQAQVRALETEER